MSLDQARENQDLPLFKQEILNRAQSAKSVKVLQQAERIAKNTMSEADLMEMQNNFYILVDDPNAPEGGGTYKGWTPEEIKEYYSVLYGEKMDEDEE